MLRALAFDVVQDVEVLIVVLDLIPVHEILQQQHLDGEDQWRRERGGTRVGMGLE